MPLPGISPACCPWGASSAHPRCPRSSGHISQATGVHEEHLVCPETVKSEGCGLALQQDGGTLRPITEQRSVVGMRGRGGELCDWCTNPGALRAKARGRLDRAANDGWNGAR
ncbi:hypothetical protein NDU88_004075 [Pleurodeles waltl]|uniref:Uncharacterized protein n=1 Tax=Pleurodeles waltl TaxID=8319 RepID=A0AAV7WX43_PLEWA|nr:hypothetical protein NDU88_004075 [Pleurodeles waltl]